MESKLISIGEAAKLLGVSIQTLRRWDESGKLSSFRPTQISHRYYRREDIELFLNDLIIIGKNWAKNKNATEPLDIYYCKTRDVFEGRLVRLQNELAKVAGLENIFPLIVSAAGEIGNNSFDHNLGIWPDVPGIFFGYDLARKKLILADRGQGILQSLKRVRPNLQTHEEALLVAFSEVVSGRAPEARGNGLKFVRKVVTENPLSICFQSGSAELVLKQNQKKLKITTALDTFHGCIAIIYYS
ncbi:MAG: helix-turn-helix domain-containing protein [Patescibacteria group bacterium]